MENLEFSLQNAKGLTLVLASEALNLSSASVEGFRKGVTTKVLHAYPESPRRSPAFCPKVTRNQKKNIGYNLAIAPRERRECYSTMILLQVFSNQPYSCIEVF